MTKLKSQHEPSAAFCLLSGSPQKLNSRLDQSFRNVEIKGVFYSALGGFWAPHWAIVRASLSPRSKTAFSVFHYLPPKTLASFTSPLKRLQPKLWEKMNGWFDSLSLRTRWPHWESHSTVLKVTSLSNHSESNTRVCARAHAQIQPSSNKQGQQWY